MSLLLIDDQGETWDGQSRKLRAALNSPYSGGEFSSYAVTNLGFVAVNIYGPSCQIRLRPSIVTPSAHRTVQDWLGKVRVERVVLSTLDKHWSDELIRSSPLAQERLELIVTSAARADRQDFLAQVVGTKGIAANTPLGAMVRNWPEISRQSGQRELLELVKKALGNRYIMVRKHEDNGRIIFHELGDGLFSNYETWRTCAIGAPMEEQPDRSYGRWSATGYYETLQSAEPRVENVDAIVRWPHAGRERLRYQRVIVPVQRPGSTPLLVGGSIIDNRIDLRVGLG